MPSVAFPRAAAEASKSVSRFMAQPRSAIRAVGRERLPTRANRTFGLRYQPPPGRDQRHLLVPRDLPEADDGHAKADSRCATDHHLEIGGPECGDRRIEMGPVSGLDHDFQM